MALSYWIETLLTLPAPYSDEPRALVQQIGVEYLYPIVPPNAEAYFITTPPPVAAARGFSFYIGIFYRIRFGDIVPGTFQITIVASGLTAFSGVATGSNLTEGIDYLYFMTPGTSTTVYITNLTNMNQFFEMISQYLIVSTEEDWKILKKYMKAINFPYKIPEEL